MINQNQLPLLSFVKKWDTAEYNNRRQSCWTPFSVKRFNSNELIQINHDCETENVHHSQSFW